MIREIGDALMVCGDCLGVMPHLDRVDMVLTDLPYGTTACAWDAVIPFAALWPAYHRVVKRGGPIVLTASQPFTSALVMSNPRQFRYEWIWRKTRATGFLSANIKPLKAHESVLVFCDKAAPYYPQGVDRTKQDRKLRGPGPTTKVYLPFGRDYQPTGTNMPQSVLTFGPPDDPVHPTQKPVDLMAYLIRTYTRPGQTVLDNTMGSGSTGVACVNTGRRFVGIEMDPDYYAIALDRVGRAHRSPGFFKE